MQAELPVNPDILDTRVTEEDLSVVPETPSSCSELHESPEEHGEFDKVSYRELLDTVYSLLDTDVCPPSTFTG